MKKSGLFVAVVVALLAVCTSIADAGRVAGRAARGGSLDAQLGVRFANQLPENIRQGDTFEATVLNPEKLAGFGLQNAKRGDKISIKILSEDGKFQILHQGALSRQLLLNEQGRVSPIDRPVSRPAAR